MGKKQHKCALNVIKLELYVAVRLNGMAIQPYYSKMSISFIDQIGFTTQFGDLEDVTILLFSHSNAIVYGTTFNSVSFDFIHENIEIGKKRSFESFARIPNSI